MFRHEKLLTAFQRGLLTGALLLLISGLAQSQEPNRKQTVTNDFHSRDQNGDGRLSLEEYLTSPGASDPKVLKRDFKVVDFDGDGKLTLEEFKALPGLLPVAERGAVADPIVDLAAQALKNWRKLLKQADRNQDGKLSATEWPQAALQAQLAPFGELKFAVWDFDENGSVDDSEAERLIDVGYGVRHPDGVSMRTPNGKNIRRDCSLPTATART